MELSEAKAVCAELAELKKRWGRHAGNGPYNDATVRKALLVVYEAGLFDIEDNHADIVLANRQKGAAEARATKYKADLDKANARIQELEKQVNSQKVESKKGFFK